MSLIFKYLKPYFLVVLAIIALTFCQVQSELSLPDYMSDIVTNGIQYGGITDTVPLVVDTEDMDTIMKFVEEKDRDKVLAVYQLVNSGNSIYINNQEQIVNKDVYVLNGDYNQILDVIEKPLVYAYLLPQSNIDIDAMDIEEVKTLLDKKLVDLEDNYGSVIKIYTQSLYNNVGLSVSRIQNNYILSVGLKMILIAALGVIVNLCATYLTT